MSVDESKRELWEAMQHQRAQESTDIAEPLHSGGGGGTLPPMESRVSALETHMTYVRRDLDDLRTGQAQILDRLSSLDHLATKSDLRTFRWQWLATAAAAFAIIVGGIIGGLGWIKPDAPIAAAATPIVITVPSTGAVQPGKPIR